MMSYLTLLVLLDDQGQELTLRQAFLELPFCGLHFGFRRRDRFASVQIGLFL